MTKIKIIDSKCMEKFRGYLYREEKSEYTIEKYLRDVKSFSEYLNGEEITRDRVIEYKKGLIKSGKYEDSSINSMISSLRALFKYIGRNDCIVENIKIQEMPYNPEEKSLDKSELERLLKAAEKDRRLYLLLLVMFTTGIRVSEIKYFTVEALRGISENARVTVSCKKKNRRALVTEKLKKELVEYIEENDIKSGPVFRTRNGKAMDRSNIWKQMKKLCEKAGVNRGKVFPHNIRKLFARLYYETTHDIVQLSCLLGHSSINTTKIYVKTTEKEISEKVERMIHTVFTTGRKGIKNTTLSA